MSKVDELKTQIARLSGEDIAEIFRWLSEKDWEMWDKEIEADSRAGKLDFLVQEARKEKSAGNLKDFKCTAPAPFLGAPGNRQRKRRGRR